VQKRAHKKQGIGLKIECQYPVLMFMKSRKNRPYRFFLSFIAAWAAASLAIGTLKGEQDT